MKKNILEIYALAACVLSLATAISAQTLSENMTGNYFETVKTSPDKLTHFLQRMPKGGDLHSHLSGSSLAENLIDYAKKDALCVDQQTFSVSDNIKCSIHYRLDKIPKHSDLYNLIIDAWSMRNFHQGQETGHHHFFSAFGKFSLISKKYTGEILSEIAQRAGEQNELYLELMVSPDDNASGMLGKTLGWNADFAIMREKLLAAGLKEIVRNISEKITADEAKLNHLLYCGSKQEKSGCGVKIRYLYQAKREQPPEQVFAQLLAGFESANSDARIVGINLVQPEDGVISMRDYDLHMKMIAFLHHLYPKAHISLHAGELVPGLVTPQGLRSHIRNAVTIAKAARIGHGVDIAYENEFRQLLNEMAKKHILVEINLSSNAAILGVAGKNHPLPLYMRHNVAVALSTDDEGILRTNLTEQYKNAVITYQLSYIDIKKMARNSIAYSFLPGQNLWNDYHYHQINTACAKDIPGNVNLSLSCQTFLNVNEKARMQWKLEKQFSDFEMEFTHYD